MFWKSKIRLGNTYACQTGIHAGKMLIYIDKNSNQYGFLSSPTMENVWIPIDKFDFGIENGIIEYVERVPKIVRKVADAKWRENKDIIRYTE
jgi:hypothetical protein